MAEVAEYIRQTYGDTVSWRRFASAAVGDDAAPQSQFRPLTAATELPPAPRYPVLSAATPHFASLALMLPDPEWQVSLCGVSHTEWVGSGHPALPQNVLPDRVRNEQDELQLGAPCSIQVRKAVQFGRVLMRPTYEIKVNDTVWIHVRDHMSDQLKVSLAEEHAAVPAAEAPHSGGGAAAAPPTAAGPVVAGAAINSSSSSDDDESDLLPPHTHAGGGLMF